MIIPIGPPGGYQELWRLQRLSPDEVESTNLGGVRFVPLVRQAEGGSPDE
jgi:protein-L-isoaspartate O-methyltransferase